MWNDSGSEEFSDEPIQSFILYFTTGADTKDTDQYHTIRRMTSYIPENISSIQNSGHVFKLMLTRWRFH